MVEKSQGVAPPPASPAASETTQPLAERQRLLRAAARNLQDFGYSDVTPEEVLTVRIFWLFSRPWFEERAKGGEVASAELLKMGDAIFPRERS